MFIHRPDEKKDKEEEDTQDEEKIQVSDKDGDGGEKDEFGKDLDIPAFLRRVH